MTYVTLQHRTSLRSVLPGWWVPVKVNHRENYNVSAIDTVEDTVGKLAQNRPPYISVNNLILNWIAGNSIYSNGIK